MKNFRSSYQPANKSLPVNESDVFFQPKLAVNEPGDQYEKQADAVAGEVMGMEKPFIQPEPGIQCESDDTGEENHLSKEMPIEETAHHGVENYINNLNSNGQPMPEEVRHFYEPRFGYDFSDVKLHTDSVAAKSARSINALAYTSGNNIVFNEGMYSPQTNSGKKLLAHELTHVVQQNANAAHRKIQRRGPVTADPMHDPLLDQFSRETGTPREMASQHSPAYEKWLSESVNNKLYSQAVQQLSSIDPVLHRYLSLVSPNGNSVAIRSGSLTTQDVPPVTLNYSFNLTVAFNNTAAQQLAVFDQGTINLTPTGNPPTLSADMNISINKQALTGANAAGELAQSLFHEGIHMIIFMDNLLPVGKPSAYTTGNNNYHQIASKHKDFQSLLAQVKVQIETDLKTQGQTPAQNFSSKAAKEIMDHIIEEKFVFDQERKQFGNRFSNSTIATAYLQEGFQSLGVTANTGDKNFIRIRDLIVAVLDHVDAQSQPQKPSPSKP